MNPKSLENPGGTRYAILFRDGFSKYSWLHFLTSKSEALRSWDRLLANTRPESTVKTIRCDNRPKFAGSSSRLRDNHRVRREFTNAGTPQQNCSVEHAFGSFDFTQIAAREAARVLFPDADIPKTVISFRRKLNCGQLIRSTEHRFNKQ